jgi:hypothetical protein
MTQDQTQLLREALAERLRNTVKDIRRKPYPISELIPLLVQAADTLSQPAQPAPDAFREAVQEECDLLHIPMPADPREAVKAVVAANVRIALDPAVSREAQALIDQGKAAQPQGAGEAVGHIARFFSDVEALIEFSPHQGGSLRVGDKLYTTPPASQQAAQAVPEGWQLVPIEPTEVMGEAYLKAAKLHAADGAENTMRFSWGGYQAMLRAAKGEQ